MQWLHFVFMPVLLGEKMHRNKNVMMLLVGIKLWVLLIICSRRKEVGKYKFKCELNPFALVINDILLIVCVYIHYKSLCMNSYLTSKFAYTKKDSLKISLTCARPARYKMILNANVAVIFPSGTIFYI